MWSHVKTMVAISFHGTYERKNLSYFENIRKNPTILQTSQKTSKMTIRDKKNNNQDKITQTRNLKKKHKTCGV